MTGQAGLQTFAVQCSVTQFIELYLDLNHVSIIHPGLNSWIDVRSAKFEFSKTSSVQTAEFNPYKTKRGSYKIYYEAWMDTFGEPPKFGAIWELEYPGKMIETYPGMLVVSTVVEDGDKCFNYLEFRDTANNPDIFEAAKTSYLETADEDNVILENIAFDILMANELGNKVSGTFHPVLKHGIKQYHKHGGKCPMHHT